MRSYLGFDRLFKKTQTKRMELFRGIMHYLDIVIFCMFLMYQFPEIALWLPNYLFGGWIP